MNFKFFDESAAYFPDVCFSRPPDIGILLGSGWGEALEMDEVVFRASYADIPGLGASTVKGHAGEFVLYTRGGKLVSAGSRWCFRSRCCAAWDAERSFSRTRPAESTPRCVRATS